MGRFTERAKAKQGLAFALSLKKTAAISETMYLVM